MQLQHTKMEKIVKILDTKDPRKIEYAFKKLLIVPEEELKPRIIQELMIYLKTKLHDDSYPLKVFISKQGGIISGIVVSQIDTEYRSYGRRCGTFGWLYALNFESCEFLMKSCETFMRAHKIYKIRGPINYPKFIGGIGFQIKGFDHNMMSGVNYHHPKMYELKFLKTQGYQIESKYSCVKVTNTNWKKGNKLDNAIKIRYKSIQEFEDLIPQMKKLAQRSFYSILADASGGDERLNEFFKLFRSVPKSFYTLSKDFNPKDYTEVSEFITAMTPFSSGDVIPWVHMAFDKNTDKLVGIIICLPNLYQIWKGQNLTESNVDTAIVNKNYTGKGIFSSLNNIGRIALEIHGINYFEGTTIWANNEKAINTIFPHSKVVREYLVLQKRI
ncbi:MAG: hypothetical protein EU547_06940 [Promethearchaeota archaeon]|nr:MAG: hypothetical protein EU547_06940 [Candidatus Lokiarchaeota archaeon]